jgi:hypothetical protein
MEVKKAEKPLTMTPATSNHGTPGIVYAVFEMTRSVEDGKSELNTMLSHFKPQFAFQQ